MIEASSQVGQRSLEGGELSRDRRALGAHVSEVILHEGEEPLPLATREPDDGGKVLHLFRREVINLPGHFSVHVPRVNHEHTILGIPRPGRFTLTPGPSPSGRGEMVQNIREYGFGSVENPVVAEAQNDMPE